MARRRTLEEFARDDPEGFDEERRNPMVREFPFDHYQGLAAILGTPALIYHDHKDRKTPKVVEPPKSGHPAFEWINERHNRAGMGDQLRGRERRERAPADANGLKPTHRTGASGVFPYTPVLKKNKAGVAPR
jgi:hypothetical protein